MPLLCVCLDGESVMGLSELCGEECPQQLIGCCPFPLPSMGHLQHPDSQSCCPSALCPESHWACGDDPSLPGSCFYHLHMHGGPLASEGPDFGTAAGGNSGPHVPHVEFSLPSTSPPSSAVISSHFQAFIPSSIPALSHSDGT